MPSSPIPPGVDTREPKRITEAQMFAAGWPEGLNIDGYVEVSCDDAGPNDSTWLRVMVAPDGDVHLAMQKWEDIRDAQTEPNPFPTMRVRTMAGGGRNLRTRLMLLWLMRAMQLDAADRKAGVLR
jgi:hypothetical protein